MFHMIAFAGAQTTSTPNLANIPGVQDPVVRVAGNYIYMPALSSIAGTYAVGPGITRAQLQAPSLRRFANIDVAPAAAIPGSKFSPLFTSRYDSPIKLDQDEALQAFATNATTAGTNIVGVQLSDGPATPVTGEIVSLQFSIVISGSDFTWNNFPITLLQTLPVGNYNLVGCRLEGVGLALARWVPVGGIFRPGFIPVYDALTADPYSQRNGRMGNLLTFNQLTPPTIDVLSAGASGTYYGYIDLIQAT